MSAKVTSPSVASPPAGRNIDRTSHTDEAVLDDLQRKAFRFFERHVNPHTGLVLDSTRPTQPASIAAVGFALSCYPIGVERGWMPRTPDWCSIPPALPSRPASLPSVSRCRVIRSE